MPLPIPPYPSQLRLLCRLPSYLHYQLHLALPSFDTPDTPLYHLRRSIRFSRRLLAVNLIVAIAIPGLYAVVERLYNEATTFRFKGGDEPTVCWVLLAVFLMAVGVYAEYKVFVMAWREARGEWREEREQGTELEVADQALGRRRCHREGRPR